MSSVIPFALAAMLYVPTGGSAGQRFPVLLEYLSYRKTEARGRNWPPYAAHGTDDLYQEDVHYIDGIMHLDLWEMSQKIHGRRTEPS